MTPLADRRAKLAVARWVVVEAARSGRPCAEAAAVLLAAGRYLDAVVTASREWEALRAAQDATQEVLRRAGGFEPSGLQDLDAMLVATATCATATITYPDLPPDERIVVWATLALVALEEAAEVQRPIVNSVYRAIHAGQLSTSAVPDCAQKRRAVALFDAAKAGVFPYDGARCRLEMLPGLSPGLVYDASPAEGPVVFWAGAVSAAPCVLPLVQIPD